ncbi:hypothetical protein ACWD3J_39955 [Streptomyces sp. NPDC002755]
MADDPVLIADPYGVRKGGAATDAIADHISGVVKRFTDRTYFNADDPAWGNDDIGREFGSVYVPSLHELRDALDGFEGAVLSAARLTSESGDNFGKAQADSLDNIQSSPTPGRRV